MSQPLHRIAAPAVALLLAACGGAPPKPEPAPPAPAVPVPGSRAMFTTQYQCAKDIRISVEQAVTRMAGQPIKLTYAGVTYDMQIVPSGSGARYVNQANQLQWFGKGDEAMLTRGSGEVYAKDCKVVKGP